MAVDPGIKILLVEDAGTMRKMEVRILKQLGFNNIIEAKDGNDAIEKLEAALDIDLVISDWAMPEKDGHELLCWIRGQEQFKDRASGTEHLRRIGLDLHPLGDREGTGRHQCRRPLKLDQTQPARTGRRQPLHVT